MRKQSTQPSRPQGVWLAMSGGGMRAALFHYGALKRLFELNMLEDVEVVSATSGGSLVAALLGVHGPMINGDTERWESFEQDLLDAAANGVLGPTIWSGVAWISLLFAAVFGNLNLFLVLWTGTSSTPLTLLWVCLIVVFALAILATAGQMHFLARNSAALPNVEGKRSLTSDFFPEAATGPEGGIADHFRQSISKFFLMLDPSYVLWHSLNFRVFRNSVLNDFRLGPKIFLCAADLNSGRELVFSEKLFGELSSFGSPRLWRQYETEATMGDDYFKTVLGEDIPVATAVAACSAYPPFFASVPVFIDGQMVANCIDGGVIDNHALIITRQMAKYVDEHKADALGRTFSNTIGRVLALDASGPVQLYRRYFWLRISALPRLGDLLHNRQIQGELEDLDDIQRLFNVSARAISLRTRPDEGCALKDPEIARLAARVRTHFDSFSKVECAVLAYLGYYWADRWAETDFPARNQESPKARMRGIADILPACFAPPAAMLVESKIVAHLRYSGIGIRSWRWLRRYIARA
jgi:hypothetical protein